MAGKYNFTVALVSEKGHKVEIDTSALYGYWEYASGVEGGGLWFERLEGGGLELVDFDGAYSLPQAITNKLRAEGYTVGAEFDVDLAVAG